MNTSALKRGKALFRRVVRGFNGDQATPQVQSDSDPVVAVIKRSGLFDEKWYLERYPRVAASGMDPVVHYVRYGASEGRDPSPHFDTRFYLSKYRDVASRGMNPLRHYIQWGMKEGRFMSETDVRGKRLTDFRGGKVESVKLSNAKSNTSLSFSLLAGRSSWLDIDEIKAVTSLVDRLKSSCFILHVSEGAESLHHLDVWLPVFKKFEEELVIVIRTKQLYERIVQERPDTRVVYIKNGRNAEWLVKNSPLLKAVFYVSNTGTNVHFLRHTHLRHVFIGHGDSEKVASCSKYFRSYDEVWVAGLAHIDRFRNAGFDCSSIKFRVVGRPIARMLVKQSVGSPSGQFLYLPTWEGYQDEQNYSSVLLIEKAMPRILAITGLDACVKFHPFNGKEDETLKEVEKRLRDGIVHDAVPSSGSPNSFGGNQLNQVSLQSNVYKFSLPLDNPEGEMRPARQPRVRVAERTESATELMEHADFLVGDISSVISDFLVTGKPIFLFLPANRDVGMSSSSVPLDHYCYIYSDADELVDLIEKVIHKGDDYLQASRLAARSYFVDIDRTKEHQFEHELRCLMGTVSSDTTHGDMEVNEPDLDDARSLIVAHRGVTSSGVPENSIEALRAAAALEGLDAVEFDVHMAADGEPVVMHDADLSRTTDGQGFIGDMDLKSLKCLRLKDPKGSLTELTIPTLEEALEALVDSSLELHVELKSDALGNPYAGLSAKILDLLRRFDVLDRTILTSFTPSVLKEVRYMDGHVRLLASVNARVVEMLGGLEKSIRHFHSSDVCRVAFDKHLSEAIEVLDTPYIRPEQMGIWVVNGERALRDAFSHRYRQVTTDEAELALRLRSEILPQGDAVPSSK